MDSEIAKYFSDKTVLLTGSTGFLGKVLAEKILRACRPKALYLLVRKKKGKTPQERLQQLLQQQVFKRVTDEGKNGVVDTVKLVTGDTSLPLLGISEEAAEDVRRNVEVVIHCAATVTFTEPLQNAVTQNVFSTLEVIKLCRQIKNLQSVVFTSTAYVHSMYQNLHETIYTSPMSPDHLMKIVHQEDTFTLEAIKPKLLGTFPNVYSFTKAVSEETILKYGQDLPLAIFRPAIIVAAKDEPSPYWCDSWSGMMGLISASAAGINRIAMMDGDKAIDLVPVDMSANALIAITYKTGVDKKSEKMPIYNYASSENPLKMDDYTKLSLKHGKESPSLHTLYYYTMTMCTTVLVYKFLSFFFHLLPALFGDFCLYISNNKPRLLKQYQLLQRMMIVVGYYSVREWTFHNENTQALWKSLTDTDRKFFNFDMKSVDWDNMVYNVFMGARVHNLRDSVTSLPKAKRRFFWLQVIHRIVQLVFYGTLSYILYSFISKKFISS